MTMDVMLDIAWGNLPQNIKLGLAPPIAGPINLIEGRVNVVVFSKIRHGFLTRFHSAVVVDNAIST